MVSFSKCEEKFKENTVHVFREHCATELFTIKFHLLKHLYEDLDRFGGVIFLNASAYEHIQIVAKIPRSVQKVSMSRPRRLSEILCELEWILAVCKEMRDIGFKTWICVRERGIPQPGEFQCDFSGLLVKMSTKELLWNNMSVYDENRESGDTVIGTF